MVIGGRDRDVPVRFLDLILVGGRRDAEGVVEFCFGDHVRVLYGLFGTWKIFLRVDA